MRSTRLLASVVAAGVLLAACGDGDDSTSGSATPATEAEGSASDSASGAEESGSASEVTVDAPAGVTLASPTEAAAFIDGGPDDQVILDVRTPEEFAEGHIAGAINVDIYEPTFADEIDALDRGVPYVVYCRSGNRSAQATSLMDDLAFESVLEIDGGVVAWTDEGLPLVTG